MIRIPLKLRHGGREAFIEAVLNTGFEADAPILSLPLRTAEELGLRLRGREGVRHHR